MTDRAEHRRRARHRGHLGPLSVPAFRSLFAGQFVSAVGDKVFPIAVAALIVARGGSAGELGAVFAARFTALVLFALLGGVWADRLPRVRVLRSADLLRMTAVGGLFVATISGDPPFWVLVGLVFGAGMGEAFFRPAYGALLPTLLPPDDLAAGNALSRVSLNVARVAGPGLAATLLWVTEAPVLFAVDAVTFAVSLATLARVAEPDYRPSARRRTWREVADGVDAIRKRPWVATVLGMASIQQMLVVAPAIVLLPLVVRDIGASPAGYGLVLAVGAVGGLLGATLAGLWQPAHPGVAGLLSLTSWSLPPLALLLEVQLPLLAAAWFIAAAGQSPFYVWWETGLQRAVPRELLARVVSLDWMCSLAVLPVGLAVVGPAVEIVGRRPVLLTAVAVMVLTSLLPLLVPGVSDLRSPARHQQSRFLPPDRLSCWVCVKSSTDEPACRSTA